MPQLGWAIFAVIFINAIFSFWQEFRAEKATEALKKMIPHNAKVIRDGKTVQIPAAELVPGDLMVLEEGDAISADARLIEEFELRTNNATLTGESEPVRKTASPHDDPNLTLIEMPNLVFAGTSVAYGGGKAIVFATGMETQFGKIAELTQSVESELSPLQKEMSKVTQLVAVVATCVGVIFFVLGYFFGGLSLMEGFIFSVGIIVAFVPEGLLPDGHALAGHGGAAHGRARCAHQEAVVGRDARLHHGHLHRQDRHADQERDDGARHLGRRPAPRGLGRRLRSDRRVPR